MDLHRLAEERSLAYHRAIAERIAQDPSVLDRARERVRAWITGRAGVPEFARAWDEVLARPLPELLRFLTDESERARELRQSTPFAGALPPRVRWEIWRAVRDRRAGTG